MTTDPQPTVYLAGPMSGYEDYNAKAFNDAATEWRKAGWRVINPSELDGEDAGRFEWSFYMRRDLAALATHADAIAMLEGWEKSRGALLERTVADGLGIRVFLARRVAAVPQMHKYIEGTNVCCDWPDYMHWDLWRNQTPHD